MSSDYETGPSVGRQIMMNVGGKPFRCQCGANVFTLLFESDGETHYRCNGCKRDYVGEKAMTPTPPTPGERKDR